MVLCAEARSAGAWLGMVGHGTSRRALRRGNAVPGAARYGKVRDRKSNAQCGQKVGKAELLSKSYCNEEAGEEYRPPLIEGENGQK